MSSPPIHLAMAGPIPWAELAGPIARAGDLLARLDERISKSPIREGFIARTHFHDSCASLWIEGALVHLEDLVLHDALMDIHSPTHDLTRAHQILRARKKIAGMPAGWALSAAGLDALIGGLPAPAKAPATSQRDSEVESDDDSFDGEDAVWADEFAALDAASARAAKHLAAPVAAPPAREGERDAVIYDPDWDEPARLAQWRGGVEAASDLPPILAAALALDAWDVIEPLRHFGGLGAQLAADLLRARGATQSHLACLNIGLRAVPREKRRARDRIARVTALIGAIAATAEEGLKNHDRWSLARQALDQKTIGRRKNSTLPALVDLVMKTPMLSAGMIARELSVSPRAVLTLVADLGLREVTGRGRYRAWGVL